MNDQVKEQDFFEKFGLEVTNGEVEKGKTYPIYGMITKFLEETQEHLEVELNFNIIVRLKVPDQEKVNTLKERSFDPGIFVCTIIEDESPIVADCTTVIFGKRSAQTQ